MSQSILGDDQKALQLVQLLQALQNPDNVQRTEAEELLASQWTTPQPDALLCGLAEQVQRAPEQATRAFAAVLFRRMATKTRKDSDEDATTELFLSIQPQAQQTARQKMLECLLEEKVAHVRDKIGDGVAEIARQYSDNGQVWPELLGALSHLSQSDDAGQRSTAFRIFATTPDIIGKEHEPAIIAAFAKGFKDIDIGVRLASMEAYASFFESLSKGGQKKYFPLIGDVLAILPPVRDSKDDDQLTRALVALLELAETAPKMFKDHFRDLVKFSISVVQDAELDDTPRQNALELMTTFAEHHPAMCRKDPEFTSEMVKQCLALMTDVGTDDDDAAIWNDSVDLDADESDANHVAGEQCMDRLANKLGGNTLVHPVFMWIPNMMVSSSWREKHAALMAISAISEGCREIMEPELMKVLETILPALNDPHPRVRWAGCNALGQMSTDFATTMQEKYAQIVVPALIHVLDAPEPRVQSHAAAALVNFCEEAEKEVLEPYLNDLLTKLHGLLQKPQRFVQEQALSTIATVADSAEAAFANYYDVLMPLMFSALQQPQDKDSRLLKAKAMECATLIALAVKREKMGQDALTLMQLLDNIQSGIEDADDPQAGYLLHCWGRMCRVMGNDFVHYLPRVIPPLMTLASAKADIQLLDDEEEVARIENEEGWELVPLKGKFIGINTSTLDDKHTAIELIFIYAQNLEADFEPYVINIMDTVLIPSLAFFFHDPVRVAAAKAIPQLLSAYKKKHSLASSAMQSLWSRTIDGLLKILDSEPAIETLAEMYESFYESIEVMGRNCLTEAHMKTFVTSAESVLKDYQGRLKERLEEQAERNPDDDEEDPEELVIAIEDDASLLSDMNKAFHTVMKHHGAAFIPYWKSLLSYYATFIVDSDPTNRQWALCIIDDLLEFCGPQSIEYADMIRSALDAGLQDENPANRQASCYGVGVLAQNGGQPWADYAAAALEGLFAATRHTSARTDEHVYATENACAAISKVLKFNNSSVQNAAQITDAWIDTLPIVNDDEAAPYAYAYLNELVERGFPPLQAKAPQIFVAIAEALAAESLQGQQAQRAAGAMKALAGVVGENVMRQAIGERCSVETQAALRPYLG